MTRHPQRGKIWPRARSGSAADQVIGADVLDDLTGGWLRALADGGRLEGLLTAIAIDGKWLRGVADGQVKLFAAMLQEEKVMIAQHRIPDETTGTTQVKALLDIVDLGNAVVTADAAHAQRETAEYIAGKIEDGGRDSDYAVTVKGNQPGQQRDIYDKVTADAARARSHRDRYSTADRKRSNGSRR